MVLGLFLCEWVMVFTMVFVRVLHFLQNETSV